MRPSHRAKISWDLVRKWPKISARVQYGTKNVVRPLALWGTTFATLSSLWGPVGALVVQICDCLRLLGPCRRSGGSLLRLSQTSGALWAPWGSVFATVSDFWGPVGALVVHFCDCLKLLGLYRRPGINFCDCLKLLGLLGPLESPNWRLYQTSGGAAAGVNPPNFVKQK